MLRSLFAGVSGLRSHQIRMDVIANNIANVNTIGFKASEVTFSELLAQSVREASAPSDRQGGVDPQQVGLGTQVASISVLQEPGPTENTGRVTDLAIEGDGFFAVGDPADPRFTRAGQFKLDALDTLVHAGSGLKLLGWLADSDGRIDTSSPLAPLTIPKQQTLAPRATTEVRFEGNLDARLQSVLQYDEAVLTAGGQQATMSISVEPLEAFNEFRWTVSVQNGTLQDANGQTVGSLSGTFQLQGDGTVAAVGSNSPTSFTVTPLGTTSSVTVSVPSVGALAAFTWNNGQDSLAPRLELPSRSTSIVVYDSVGKAHDLTLTFTRRSDSVWDWTASGEGVQAPGGGTAQGSLTFDTSGKPVALVDSQIVIRAPGADDVSLRPDFSALTSYAADHTAVARSQDGYAPGTLRTFAFDPDGRINGLFSNGRQRVLGQVALALFSNPAGLEKVGNSLFAASHNSGEAQITTPVSGRAGKVTAGYLEMSNVDLSEEFTKLIVTQRGFQANSRVITTSDEVLQELVNLKR